MSEIKRGSSEIITFLYGIDSRGTVKNTTFRKKSKSKKQFFEKSTSPKGNFRGAVAPLLLEIELK